MIALHCIDTYLPITCNWIYNQIVFNKTFTHKVLTNSLQNEASFPLPTRALYTVPYFFLKDVMYYNDKRKEKTLNIVRNGMKPFNTFIFKKIGNDVGTVDMMHVHFGTNALGLLPFKKYLGVPMITSFYGHDILKVVQHHKELYKKLFEVCELFLVEGSNAKKVFVDAGFDGEKIKINHLGEYIGSIPFRERRKEGTVKLFMLARFVEKKGILNLIKALGKIRHHDWRFTLVGDGELKPQIIQLIKDNKIEDKVILRDKFIQPHQILGELLQHDIFVHPSITAKDGDSEGGAPTILFTASASGMPIVATFHADIPEVVLHNKTGLLAKEYDVDDLAKQLEKMITQDKLWVGMGKAGREHIKANYNAEIQGMKLGEIYTQLITNYKKAH